MQRRGQLEIRLPIKISMIRLLDIIFDLIMFAAVARMLAGTVRRLFGSGAPGFSPKERFSKPSSETVQGKTARDPVCGMFVSTELSHRLQWHGQLLHFCSEECLQQYRRRASA
jgi:YHS domain-containing protein